MKILSKLPADLIFHDPSTDADGREITAFMLAQHDSIERLVWSHGLDTKTTLHPAPCYGLFGDYRNYHELNEKEQNCVQYSS